jgi:hypothetical protein
MMRARGLIGQVGVCDWECYCIMESLIAGDLERFVTVRRRRKRNSRFDFEKLGCFSFAFRGRL